MPIHLVPLDRPRLVPMPLPMPDVPRLLAILDDVSDM